MELIHPLSKAIATQNMGFLGCLVGLINTQDFTNSLDDELGYWDVF